MVNLLNYILGQKIYKERKMEPQVDSFGDEDLGFLMQFGQVSILQKCSS